MIKVLIVDDTRTVRAALRRILERDSEIIVVGEAADGNETMRMIHRYDPDFVTMDVYLEQENGLRLTKNIMIQSPRPILVITGINPEDPKLVYRALENGALDVFPKPPGPDHPSYERQAEQLIRLVKTLSKVPVIHHHRPKDFSLCDEAALRDMPAHHLSRSSPSVSFSQKGEDCRTGVLLIGASTGGPPVVCELLKEIPKPGAVPVVVVQHITSGFSKGFADWLQHAAGHRAVLVERAMELEAGTVYIAADNKDFEFLSSTFIKPVQNPAPKGARPSIDRLFLSAAQHCRAPITAVLLTGMGTDGAEGLAALRAQGATTLGQALETCAVDSMPASAIKKGAVQKVLAPKDMAAFLANRFSKGSL